MNIKTLQLKYNYFDAIQYTKDNTLDILDFCKYCYLINNTLTYKNISIDPDDWIIKLTNEEFVVIDNTLKEQLFK